MSVRATIIDHDALDKAVLAAAKGSGGETRTSSAGKHTTSGVSGLQSLAEIRKQNAAKTSAQRAEAERLFAQGEQAEAAGKYGVARIFYRRAAKVDHSGLSKKIATRLAALDAVRSIDK